MDETIKKINDLLKKFNNTFEISPIIAEGNDEQIADGLKIDKLKNDGSEFVNELFDVFDLIVKSVSDEHEVIYNEEKGLVIAKKVVNYVIED